MSCATLGCSDLDCPCCSVNRRFPPMAACARLIDGRPCRLFAGHPYRCQPSRTASEEKQEAADLRDSKPVEALTGERAASAKLAYRKRQREGPLGGNAFDAQRRKGNR